MMYLALVVRNSETTGFGKPPVPGAILVACPRLFGFQENVPEGTTENKLWQYANWSDWVFPLVDYTNDVKIPDIGDYVVIEEVVGTSKYFWRSMCLYQSPYKNRILLHNGKVDSLEMDQYDQDFKQEPDEYKTRIIGTKNGTKIVFYDSWIKEKNNGEKRSGKFKIIVGGKNKLNMDREGIEIEIDATEDSEKFIIKTQTKDGSNPQTITIDQSKDKEFIEIKDKAEQTIILDSSKNAEKIEITDKAGQIFTMTSKDGSEKIEIADKESQKFTMDPVNKSIKIVDYGNQEIFMDGTKKVTSLKSGNSEIKMDGSANKFKISNGVFDLKTIIDNIITATKSIVTTGSPTVHTVNQASQEALSVISNSQLKIFME